ncbi:DinB family protein [Chengkuizengella axinellae]|uniref:DinB family protein n=1 Tax=Chengkuizengella axinellae TaxID=3064388 RepID=A0ABT9J2B9_9BACL|nr:DinB family protein [Chengkuizengella sp. 2205SS18-9]MDP5275735.1 DinB family protein [Chengkuizengella sp. 2205SS18-9]
MSNEKKELLVKFNQWTKFVENLKDERDEIWNKPIAVGKWTIREVVSHIMLWDQIFYERAIDKIANQVPLTLKHTNFDEFNEQAKQYGRTTSVKTLSENSIFYRKKIIEQIETLSDENYNKVYTDKEGKAFHVTQYLKDFLWHDKHHMDQMKECLGLK